MLKIPFFDLGLSACIAAALAGVTFGFTADRWMVGIGNLLCPRFGYPAALFEEPEAGFALNCVDVEGVRHALASVNIAAVLIALLVLFLSYICLFFCMLRLWRWYGEQKKVTAGKRR